MKFTFTKNFCITIGMVFEMNSALHSQKLYNTTGSDDGGSVVRFNVADNSIDPLGLFASVSLASPTNELVHAGEGHLYGLVNNSPSLYGGIFMADTTTDVISALYNFDNVNRAVTGLTLADDGKLYTVGGTLTAGSYLSVYAFDPTDNTYTEVAAIPGASYSSAGKLLRASNGFLYGVSQYNGDNDQGMIFSFDPGTNALTSLFSFDTNSGTLPKAGMIQAANGMLYGLAAYGGANDKGTLFSFDINTNMFTKLFDFVQSTGENPSNTLMQASSGMLYGTTMTGGANYQGALYSFDTVSNTYTLLHSFFAGDGYNPRSYPTEVAPGILYGTTSAGGANYSGTIYKFDTGSSTYTKLVDGDDNNSFSGPFLYIESPSTAVAELTSSNYTIQPFPNPCTDRIQIDGQFAKGIHHYAIKNTLGQTVQAGTLNNNTIPTSELVANVYSVIISDNKSKVAEGRFIKQ